MYRSNLRPVVLIGELLSASRIRKLNVAMEQWHSSLPYGHYSRESILNSMHICLTSTLQWCMSNLPCAANLAVLKSELDWILPKCLNL
jgi:hypothetical protein